MEKQNFSLSLFGKNLQDIELDDLNLFFSEAQTETSFLECKSGNTHIEKLIKEVCAFLNTDGGILILGAPRENQDKKCIGSLTPVICCNNEDQLSRKISSNISPLPTGIEYRAVKHNDGLSYVIEIQPSSYAPHQDNKSGIYYIRINEEKKAAPHSLVEALFFKRQRPKFNLVDGHIERKDTIIRYSGGVINEAPYPADRISHLITIVGIKNSISSGFKESSPFTFQCIQQNEYSIIQGVQWLFDFEFEVFLNEPFLISHLVWSKEGRSFREYILVKPETNEGPNHILYDEEKSAAEEYTNLREINLNQIILELPSRNEFNYNELRSLLSKMKKDYRITYEEDEDGERFTYFVRESDFLELIFIKKSGRVDVALRYSIKGELNEIWLNPPKEN